MSKAIQCDWCHEYAPCPIDRFRAQVTGQVGLKFEITIMVRQIREAMDIEADLCETCFRSVLREAGINIEER